MINHHKGYPKCIKRALLNMGNLQKKLFELRQTAQDAEEVLERHADKLQSPVVFASVAYCKHIQIMAQVDHVKDVLPVLRDLAKRGYRRTKPMEETPESNKREYFLTGIQVEIQLSGTVCKYVKVGEETVKKDVFELKCDGVKLDNVEVEQAA